MRYGLTFLTMVKPIFFFNNHRITKVLLSKYFFLEGTYVPSVTRPTIPFEISMLSFYAPISGG